MRDDVRGKLIELLMHIPQVNYAEARVQGVKYVFECVADYLIANGVTVQDVPDTNVGKWIPVTERLPDNDYGKHWKDRARYNVIVNGVVCTATFGFRDRNWWVDHRGYVFDKEHYKEVTHWQPAPEPPKEGE